MKIICDLSVKVGPRTNVKEVEPFVLSFKEMHIKYMRIYLSCTKESRFRRVVEILSINSYIIEHKMSHFS